MSFIIKFVSALLIIITIYVVCIFVFPKQTDKFAENIGTVNLNKYLRDFKTWTDSVWEDLIQIKAADENIKKARTVINDINDSINQINEEANNKVNQVNKVIESSKKVIDSTNELKNNLWDLTTISSSWSSKTTQSGSLTESWSTSSWLKSTSNVNKLKNKPTNISNSSSSN